MTTIKKCVTTFWIFFCTILLQAQTVFHTEDIAHFYEAFDSVQTTTDKQKQIDFVQKLYVAKGSVGLQYAKKNSLDGGKIASASDWVDMMNSAKESFQKIRPYFENLPSQKAILEQKFKYFKEQYPKFKDGNVYFFVGLGIFGGRPEGDNLYIGCELMAKDKPDWAVSIVLHEFVHTLQKRTNDALLAHCLNEGAADFIAEVIDQKSLRETYPNGYIDFGYQNEKAVWEDFKKYIASDQKGNFYDWLYGTKGRNINETQMKDLGYFVGYRICQAHYENATDKKQAIREIIEMDVSDNEYARTFLLKSGYVPKDDVKFVKKFKFKRISESKKRIKYKQFGYKIIGDKVVFEFKPSKSLLLKATDYVTVAGSFNGWNPNNLNYKMTKINKDIYQFSIPKSDFKEKKYEFKFVVNGENWQSVPENAKNTNAGNFTLEVR